MCAAYTQDMFGLMRRKRAETELDKDGEGGALGRSEEPNPAVALAVGLIYVFRTSAGARLMRELEGAVRKYTADPQALWRLVREGGEVPLEREVIDTTAEPAKELPPK
ncbi:MAG: hypothetical protein JWN44_2061 [Myxococcales bacterium]|nr:hypothetical protein [Myxococcales bacterium]